MYRGSAYILLGRWIDAYDHIHVVRRKPRGRRKKAVSPFLSTFFLGGEGVPLFVIRPNIYFVPGTKYEVFFKVIRIMNVF